MKTYDAIVVGARCAGATAAIYLSRAGYSVLLVDRALFPSDVISTHVTFNNTIDSLKDVGVLDALLKTDTPVVHEMRVQFNEVVYEGPLPASNGEADSYCFRRTHFDKIMIDHAASQPNVTVMLGCRVTEVLQEGDTVVGVRLQERDGQPEEYRARIVIGADGRQSFVRREVGAERKIAVPTEYATFYGIFEDVIEFEKRQFEVYQMGPHRCYYFPTSDKHYVIAATFPLADDAWLSRFKTEGESAIFDYFGTYMPRVAQRLVDARLVEPVKGIIDFDNHWYVGMGKGWALVGDAVCFKDPGMGQGMHDAIFAARMLVSVLNERSDWNTAWDEMAALYQQNIEAAFMARFEAACKLTQVPQPDVWEAELDMHRTVSASKRATSKFFGFYNYTAERSEIADALQADAMEEMMASEQPPK